MQHGAFRRGAACAVHGHGGTCPERSRGDRAVAQAPLEHLTFARFIRAKYSISGSVFLGRFRIMSTCAAKLDHLSTHSKKSISHFLIDNFGARVLRRPPQQPVAEAGPTSNLESRTSSNPNRPSPRLEMPVSHRKQRVGPISNRPQFAFCKKAVLSASNPISLLSTFDHQHRTANV